MADTGLGGITVENAAEIVKLTEDISDLQDKIKKKQEQFNEAKKEDKKLLREELEALAKKNKLLKTEKDILSNINDVVTDVLDSTDKEAMLNYDILGNKKKLEKINKAISKLNIKASNATRDEKLKILEQVTLLQQKLGLAEKVVESNSKAANAIQAQQQITDKLLGNLNLSVKALSDMKEQARLFGQALMADKKLILLAMLAAATMALIKMVSFGKRFRDELGTTLGQSKELSTKLLTTQGYLASIGADSVKITGALTQNFGTLDAISATTVKRIGEFEKGLGIAPEHTAKIMKNMESIGGLTQDQALNQIKSVAALAKANDMIPNDIMADLADNTEFFASYAKDGGDNLAKAAMEARKLGLNLSTTAKIADSLLDFESSIEKEMEASLLTGKQLNYNRARALALEGDVAGAAKEVVKQVGGQAEFNKMNMVQRKALADSIGVSVEEMSKMTSGKPMELKKAKGDPLEGEMNKLEMATANNTTAILSATAAIIGLGAMKLFGGKGGGLKGLKSLFTGGGGKEAVKQLSKKQIAAGFGGKVAKDALLKETTKRAGGGLLSKAGGLFGKLGGKALGGAGALIFGGMDIAKGLKSGDKSKTGAGVGSIIGTGLGAFGGPVGMMVGGMVGNYLGEKIGGMMNKPKSKDASEVSAFRDNNNNAKIPQTAAEFNQQRLDSMKSGDGRFSSVPLSVANRETTTQLQSEFGDLQGGQKSFLLQSIDDGSFEEKIAGIIERMPEMMATAMKNGPGAQQAAQETQEFIDVLKGIRENTGKTYTEIGNMIAD